MLVVGGHMAAQAAEFGIARTAAPVLNTPSFRAVFGGKDGRALKTDSCGQVRELEYIALPGTIFTIVHKHRFGTEEIYQVETDRYPAPSGVRLFVDARFLSLVRSAPTPSRPALPPREQVLSTLGASVGNPYVWGGNVVGGVPELTALFYGVSRDNDSARLTLAGLDCSGLLYHATNGWTPRNTSQLVAFGDGVPIAGKQSHEIAALLEPLDLIVWNGHVVIVLDRQTAIESRLACGKPGQGGVVTTPLAKRLAEIMRTRRPADSWPPGKKPRDVFVVRRWWSGEGIVRQQIPPAGKK
jgi:hypothetical protein